MKTTTVGKLILTGRAARELLRQGFTIIDVKPMKEDPQRSIFVFKQEEGLDEAIDNIYKR